MGVAEIVGFAACWLVVATLMLWGVFTEKKRGALRLEPPAGALHPSRSGRPAVDWVIIEAAEGATTEVADRARFLASAWLASRGIDMASVRPEDLRTEVTTTGDGESTTRVLVRSTALHGSRRHR
jgi:hypothetical protein